MKPLFIMNGTSRIFLGVVVSLLSVLVVGCSVPAEVDENHWELPAGAHRSPVKLALIALEDAGKNGEELGCGDSVVFVERDLPEDYVNTGEARVQLALEELFAIQAQYYGESGLYNALYQSSLTVKSVKMEGQWEDLSLQVELEGTVLSGGVCDDPRILGQIRKTVEENVAPHTEIAIRVNGEPLDSLLSGRGE